MWSSIQILPNQVSKKLFCTFEDIDLWESHAKVHKKPSETLGADSVVLISAVFAQCSFTEMKSTFIKLQNESLPKDIDQELYFVNNSV